MPRTPKQLREAAAEIRQLAQYAQGSTYHREMQEAQHLMKRADDLEKQKSETKQRSAQLRNKDLAKIHLLSKQAGLDEEGRRDMMEQLTGKRSSGKMNGRDRGKVIAHLNRSLPNQTKKQSFPGRPNNTDSNAQLRKIEALLAEAKRPWGYARAIAEHMHDKKRLEWCDSNELSGVIAALIKDAKRHGRCTS
jgi:phage gp16-like protein